MKEVIESKWDKLFELHQIVKDKLETTKKITAEVGYLESRDEINDMLDAIKERNTYLEDNFV